jgi:lipopolysaccharide transport system ATP-binding protein
MPELKTAEIAMSVNKLSKQYVKAGRGGSKFWALKDVSFELKRGEILGVIGRNGAGKSTLLKILSQITAPTSGEVIYDGVLTSIIEIGTGFHPDLSGKENLYLSASLLGFKRQEIEEMYEEIVEFSGLNEYMYMPVKHYSSGMYLRLAFSIAFHAKIDILVLDEIIAVGDVDFRRKCYNRIRSLKDEGVSIILVSHFLEPILEFCDRCILINSGKIHSIGTPLDVVEVYMQNMDDQSDAPIDKAFGEQLPIVDTIKYNTEFLRFENELIRLNNFEILVNNQSNAKSIQMNDELTLDIECDKKYPEGGLEVVYYLINMNGVRVLLDTYGLHDNYDLENQQMSEGKYRIKCVIPSNLLNRGIFTLGLILCKNGEVIKEFENIAKFKVDTLKRTKLDDKISSIIRPKLKWDVQQISTK